MRVAPTVVNHWQRLEHAAPAPQLALVDQRSARACVQNCLLLHVEAAAASFLNSEINAWSAALPHFVYNPDFICSETASKRCKVYRRRLRPKVGFQFGSFQIVFHRTQ